MNISEILEFIKLLVQCFFYCTWPQCTYMTLYETHYKTMIMIHYNSIIMYIHVLNHDNQLEYNTMYVHVHVLPVINSY